MRVHLIDYGVGNVWNVHRALKHIGGDVVVCTDTRHLAGASAVVLPGVGAFGDCIERLHRHGFVDPVLRFAHSGGHVLAICVGMQMLADASEEFGRHRGLGLIPGIVRRLPHAAADGTALRVPNIGWRPVQETRERAWIGTPLESIRPGFRFYFVHSYNFDCTDEENVLARGDYRGQPVTAMVRYQNTFGTQFHPEKSGEAGLALLKRFLDNVAACPSVRAAE